MFTKHLNRQFFKGMAASFTIALGAIAAAVAVFAPSQQHVTVAPYAYLLGQQDKLKRVAASPITKHVNVKTQKVVTIDVNNWQSYPEPDANEGYEAFKPLFEAVGATTGVDPLLLAKFAAKESSFQSEVVAKCPKGVRCSATGLFQFTDAKWEEVVKAYGNQFNLPKVTDRKDARQNTLMAAMSIRADIELLSTVITDREINVTDLYIAHFMGRSGAVAFFKADQSKKAAFYHPKAAKSNYNVFYQNKKARTYQEVYVALDTKLEGILTEFSN